MKNVKKYKIKNLMTILMLGVLFLITSSLLLGASKFKSDKNITVVTREDGSGTKSAFMEILNLKGKADPSGVIIGTGTAAVLTEVRNNPYAIAFESLGYVTPQVKKLKINNVEASVENIKNGSYKIARPLNIVYKKEVLKTDINNLFYSFLQSQEVQKYINDNGYVGLLDNAKPYIKNNDSSQLKGEIKISGSTSLQPLMMVIGKNFEKIYPNIKVIVSGGGSGTGYQNAENGTSSFGMISEEFNTAKAPNCTFYQVAKDGIALIVNQNNPIENISFENLQNIYDAEIEANNKLKTWEHLK
ncbi:substrate-binding domain-containing protein [Fusobacterium sp. PH5-44]|uniref:substrate-binding domain-containing protein n=1 Tax=unclassified Fusobacterium TaxID=2648384 RepID=UPI003D22B56A